MKLLLSSAIVLCCATVTLATENIGSIAGNLSAGQRYLARSNWRAAISECRQGLDTLGDRYQRSTVDDDTGVKVTLAASQNRSGKYQMSAQLYCRMLAVRLELLAQKNAIIPADLVGIWANDKAVMQGRYLFEGQAIYLGTDGKGALVVGPPAIGIPIEAVFNAKTNTIEFEAIEKGRKNIPGSIKYDPNLKTLQVTRFNGSATDDRTLLRRRYTEFTDETRKNLGM
jgi:hypothetical protein